MSGTTEWAVTLYYHVPVYGVTLYLQSRVVTVKHLLFVSNFTCLGLQSDIF